MKIISLVENRTKSDCKAKHGLSLYIETKTHKILFDLGSDDTLFDNAVRRNIDLSKVDTVIISHGHFDHAGGAEELAKHFDIKIYAEEHEKETLDTPSLNLSGWEGVQKTYHADVFLKNEQEIDLAGFHIRVFHTPGHTVGGCCYYFPYEDVIFTGDSLFCGSIGRTDFKGGSMSDLVRTVKEKIMTLPEHTEVYPGHNDTTTIENERMYNPYL